MLKLPPVKYEDAQVVTTKMITDTEFFTFKENVQTVFLSQKIRDALLSGKKCPSDVTR